MTLRSIFLGSVAITFTAMLVGCGASSSLMTGTATPIGAVAPAVTAVGLQVNGSATNRLQEVQFSVAMKATTINSQTFQIADANGKAVPGVVTYDGDYHVASFMPNPALVADANYTVTLTTGVESAEGAHLASDYSYTFTTRKDTDASAIYVTSVTPPLGSVCVNPNAPVTITFSEEPDVSTIIAKDIAITGPNGSVLPVTISIDINATVVTLTPQTPLPSGNITVTVQGIGDLADKAMGHAYSWNFSTVCSGGGTGSGGGSGGGGGTGSSNNAFVYVSNPGSNSANPHGSQIFEYAAAADGALTPSAGSPYSVPVGQANDMEGSGSGKYLFVDINQGIGTYSIGSDGALTPVTSIQPEKYDTPANFGGPSALFLDKTGEVLYDFESFAYNSNNRYQSFTIQPNGSLTFVNMAGNGNPTDLRLSFTQNDAFAYGSDCLFGTQNFYGFSRSSNGGLTYFDPKANVPAPPASNNEGTSYCPYGAAAPTSNYVVIALQLGTDPYSYQGVDQLAVYAVASDGTLHTSNTAATMPTLTIDSARDYRFDPTGTYLAAGGNGGVELFAFQNGVLTPLGTYTNSGPVSDLRWDNAGHLYTYAQDSGQLTVFNVVKGVATIAPGSPYMLPIYGRLAVQPLN